MPVVPVEVVVAQCVVAVVELAELQEEEVASALVAEEVLVEAVEAVDSPVVVDSLLVEVEVDSPHAEEVVTKYRMGRTFSYGFEVLWRFFRAYRIVYSTAIDGHLSAISKMDL